MEERYEEVGMTDLQFKSFIRQLIANIEEAMNKETEEQRKDEIDKLVKRLQEDLEG